MRAKPGDRLVIKGHRVGHTDSEAEILEVRGENGEPPYRVRWVSDGRESVVYPGADALIERKRGRASANA